MGSLNKVLLMGNLTRDIELRSTSSTQQVANFGIAVNRVYTTASGERREEATFVDCEAWGKTADTMAKYLSKGRPVFIEGRLKLDQWDDKETGKKQSKLRVVVDSFQFVDSKPGSGGSGGAGGGEGGARSSAPRPVVRTTSSAPQGEAIDESDIPF